MDHQTETNYILDPRIKKIQKGVYINLAIFFVIIIMIIIPHGVWFYYIVAVYCIIALILIIIAAYIGNDVLAKNLAILHKLLNVAGQPRKNVLPFYRLKGQYKNQDFVCDNWVFESRLYLKLSQTVDVSQVKIPNNMQIVDTLFYEFKKGQAIFYEQIPKKATDPIGVKWLSGYIFTQGQLQSILDEMIEVKNNLLK